MVGSILYNTIYTEPRGRIFNLVLKILAVFGSPQIKNKVVSKLAIIIISVHIVFCLNSIFVNFFLQTLWHY